MKNIEFLAIGDIVVDAFIKLQDAAVHCNINQKDCELCVRFGDKIPYQDVTIVPAVGNSPNAAVSAARLGLNSVLYANIGDDQNGKDCLEQLKKDKVDTDFVKINPGKKTNYHYVLWYDVDRTILVKHTEFEYSLPKVENVNWIYLSSLASNTLPLHNEIASYLKNHPETKLAFQPGTFQMKLGYETLKEIYQHTHVFFCNVEEASRILGVESTDVRTLSEGIHKLGPKIVCISDGPKGAYMYDQGELWFIPIYPDSAPAIDRTGAGDAFASTFTTALALGLSPIEALSWGPINSMSVVQGIGAQEKLLSREALEKYLREAPAEYKPTKVV